MPQSLSLAHLGVSLVLANPTVDTTPMDAQRTASLPNPAFEVVLPSEVLEQDGVIKGRVVRRISTSEPLLVTLQSSLAEALVPPAVLVEANVAVAEFDLVLTQNQDQQDDRLVEIVATAGSHAPASNPDSPQGKRELTDRLATRIDAGHVRFRDA